MLGISLMKNFTTEYTPHFPPHSEQYLRESRIHFKRIWRRKYSVTVPYDLTPPTTSDSKYLCMELSDPLISP